MKNLKKFIEKHRRSCTNFVFSKDRHCSCGRDKAEEDLKAVEDNLLASEALFGFVAWLTSLEKPVVFSARNDAALAAELVNEFCKTNLLERPREGWTARFTFPKSRELFDLLTTPKAPGQ